MPLTLAQLAIICALLSALVSLTAGRVPAVTRWFVFPLLGLCGLIATLASISGLLSADIFTATLPLGLPWLTWHLRLDPLSSMFLMILGLLVTAVSMFGPGYVREFQRSSESIPVLGMFTGLFVSGMLLVIIADDVYLFMVAWEIMSLASYFLVVFQHDNSGNRRAGFLYLLMTHIGALLILLAYVVLAGAGDGLLFDSLRDAPLSVGWATVAFLLAFAGFGMKAGLIPLHGWLPEAHPAAPSHISALMSAVMLKVAVYGFLRFTFDLLGPEYISWSWGVLVLVLGSATALVGVLYALVQTDLKRVLAYSSVENIGVIFIGIGLAMVFLGTGHESLCALGLLAALFHSLNHAVFKGLLFLGSGAVLHATHERNLENMGGLLNRMPWTGFFMLIGTLSIASLPPFNGFVSEWLTLQAALQEWAMAEGILRFVIPTSAAVLALTGALALACFVRMYGIAFLGQPRSRRSRKARPVPLGMRLSQGFLGLLCIGFGLAATQMLQLIKIVPAWLTGENLKGVASQGWLWLTPVDAPGADSFTAASYAAPLVVVMLAIGWWLMSLMLRRGKVKEVHRCEPWDCGFSRPDSRMQYSATAFSQPFQRIFSGFFHVEEDIERGREKLQYRLTITDLSQVWLYQPLAMGVTLLAKKVALLQSGSIRSYLAWSLGTLVVLLWIIS